MLTLGARREPQKIVLKSAAGDEPEAFVMMAPVSPAMRRRAARSSRRYLMGVTDVEQIDADALGDIGETVSRELIRLGVLSWGGIGGEDGAPLALTPDLDTRFATANDPERPTGSIDLLLDDEELFEKLDADYVRPDAIRRAEKNGLSGSPNGISAPATPDSDTASSAAKPKRKAAAASAPTSATPSRAKRAKGSGPR